MASSSSTTSSYSSSDSTRDSLKVAKKSGSQRQGRRSTGSSVPVSLKLLVDSASQRVLFAEAGKDFVDLLFNILALPVGTVAKLISKQTMEGCLGNLYDSLEKLDDNYVHTKENLNTLLNPVVSDFTANASPVLPIKQSSSGARCIPPSRNLTIKAPPSQEGGYVKEATYLIMDDLVVMPMCITSIITFLNKFNANDAGALHEKVIDVGKDKGQELLRASLQSRTVLTENLKNPILITNVWILSYFGYYIVKDIDLIVKSNDSQTWHATYNNKRHLTYNINNYFASKYD
ncbi:hypothetical protein PTKIN_Ptkin16aG0491000 [Pterospermum kingtungense]